MMLSLMHGPGKMKLYMSNIIHPKISGTIFILICMFLLIASIEPARALDNDLSGNNDFTSDSINNGAKIEPLSDNIFKIIDEFVENHAADVEIRIFIYSIAKDTENSEFVTREIERLKNEKSHINKTLAILNNCIKDGLIPIETCNSALKKIEREENNINKQATVMAGILRQTNEKLSDEFVKISIEENSISRPANTGSNSDNSRKANADNNSDNSRSANAGNSVDNSRSANIENNLNSPKGANSGNKK